MPKSDAELERMQNIMEERLCWIGEPLDRQYGTIEKVYRARNVGAIQGMLKAKLIMDDGRVLYRPLPEVNAF